MMSEEVKKAPDTNQAPATTPARRPYEKPVFETEEIFETMALSCGKINPTQGACHAVHKNS
jgi:hypothetical protein